MSVTLGHSRSCTTSKNTKRIQGATNVIRTLRVGHSTPARQPWYPDGHKNDTVSKTHRYRRPYLHRAHHGKHMGALRHPLLGTKSKQTRFLACKFPCGHVLRNFPLMFRTLLPPLVACANVSPRVTLVVPPTKVLSSGFLRRDCKSPWALATILTPLRRIHVKTKGP